MTCGGVRPSPIRAETLERDRMRLPTALRTLEALAGTVGVDLSNEDF